MKTILIYDTTLRDGAQGEGIAFSDQGKLRIVRRLDQLGVDYIEGGFAASNPRDRAFFQAAHKEKLTHARLAAFGATRRAHVTAGEDGGVRALLEDAGLHDLRQELAAARDGRAQGVGEGSPGDDR